MKNIIKIIIRTFIALIILIILLIMLFWLMHFLVDSKTELYIDWGVDIPRPNKVDVICNIDVGRDGEYLKVWYYNEEKLEKLINNDILKNIDEQSKSFIKQKLEEYYEILDEKNKKLFNDNINIENLLGEENYFLYVKKEKDASWLLLILDYKSNKMFSFENIY